MIALYYRRIPCISFENMFLMFLFFPTKTNLYFSRYIAEKGFSQKKKMLFKCDYFDRNTFSVIFFLCHLWDAVVLAFRPLSIFIFSAFIMQHTVSNTYTTAAVLV